ncbi:MAG: transposase [Phycisphaerae bacterium]|nr:transposase [Phycisphaerae bacterium]
MDSDGFKHVLGVQEGSSENSKVVIDLLNNMVKRGVKNDRLRLFIIDGSKALRCGITSVFGKENPVQRCRIHKLRNVLSYLPKDLHSQVESTMKAAYQLETKAGKEKLNRLADWLEKEHASAAGSLREGLDETFTINELKLPKELRRCLGTTNAIESPNSGIRSRTRRVKKWKDSTMVVRWVAASLLDMEKNFRRIMGFKHLWILDTKLRELAGEDLAIDSDEAVA